MSYRQTTSVVGPDRVEDRKLFVGGLPRHTTEKDLNDYFCMFGEVENVSIVRRYTGQSRGFAFILFKDALATEEILGSGNHYINNIEVFPKRARVNPFYRKIFVCGLSTYLTNEEIKAYFGRYGEVVQFQAPFDTVQNRRKGYCFITFKSPESIEEVLRYPTQNINGKRVYVKNVIYNPDTMGFLPRRPRRRAGMLRRRDMPGYGPHSYCPGGYGNYIGFDDGYGGAYIPPSYGPGGYGNYSGYDAGYGGAYVPPSYGPGGYGNYSGYDDGYSGEYRQPSNSPGSYVSGSYGGYSGYDGGCGGYGGAGYED